MNATFLREAVIDAEAIAYNVAHLAATTGVEVIAIVKADGYGHGAVTAARAALDGGARRLGVADLAEAFQLRDAGVEAPIISWLHGPHTTFAEAVERGIEIGVSTMGQLAAAADAGSRATPTRVHLKFDSGLSRNGFGHDEWPAVLAEVARLQMTGRIKVADIFSHLSNASLEAGREALTSYLRAIDIAADNGVHAETRHLAATQGAIELPEARLDAVRAGIGIYGLPPHAGLTSAELGLRPAMTLRATVAKVRRVAAGSGVSYDHTYRTEHDTTLALVPLGYADGVPRQASGRGLVLLNGETYRVAGRVAMDQFVIDVGDASVREGDTVTLFGDPLQGAPSAADWGAAADTIDYEIVTRIGNRVPRTQA